MSKYEKEAEKYASKDFQNKSSFEYHNQYTSFIAGAEHVKKEYEEKLRWIPVEEDTPKVGTWILIQLKNQPSKNKYVTMLPKNDLEIAYIKENVICWRSFL